MRSRATSKTDTQRDARLHSTRRLLHAMGGGLREHIEQSITTTEELLQRLEDDMSLLYDLDPNARVESITRSKTRSLLLLAHAERLYDAWAKSSKSGTHRRHCKIIRAKYFAKEDISKIATDLDQTEGEILQQISTALNELSIYFFGEGGMNLYYTTSKDVKHPISFDLTTGA